MHHNLKDLDNIKISLILKLEDVQASVRIANHHPVAAHMSWDRAIPDPQIISILAGSFMYQAAGQSVVELNPGDFLFIEPNVNHQFYISPSAEQGEIAGMHFEFTPNGTWASGNYRLAIRPKMVTRPADAVYLQARFKRLAAVYESYQPYRRELVNTIATEIVLILAAHWDDEGERAVRPSQRMETILAYIRENLSGPITRQSLAKTFNLSAGHINHLFKVELGMSPTAVINRERAARAYQLIDQEGLSVAESALAVGFHDPFYFSRVFKQIYSIPPSQVASRE